MSKKEKESREPTPWRAFADWTRWEREMERVFDNIFERRLGTPRSAALWPVRSANLPMLDLFEEANELVAKVELPGCEKDEIAISVSDHTLTVKAEKKREEEIKQENYYRVERSHGSLRRSVELPVDVDAERISATFKNGLLEVRMPRSQIEASKQKRIEVQ